MIVLINDDNIINDYVYWHNNLLSVLHIDKKHAEEGMLCRQDQKLFCCMGNSTFSYETVVLITE